LSIFKLTLKSRKKDDKISKHYLSLIQYRYSEKPISKVPIRYRYWYIDIGDISTHLYAALCCTFITAFHGSALTYKFSCSGRQ